MTSMLARFASGPRVGMPSPYSIGAFSVGSAVTGRAHVNATVPGNVRQIYAGHHGVCGG